MALSIAKPVRVLLVGLGARGRKWARIVNEEPMCRPVGYVDLLNLRLEWARSRFPGQQATVTTSLDDALSECGPDLVVLATPPMGRRRDALKVLNAGCDLLSEKPLTLDFDEGVKLVQAAEAAGRAFAVGLNFRYQHCVTEARRILRSGEIGRPRLAGYTYWRKRDGHAPGLNRYPVTMRQPMLYEQLVHAVDEMRFVYDAEVTRVLCRCSNPAWSMYEGDSTVIAALSMTGGLEVGIFGTWSGQTRADHFLWRTDCDDGALIQRQITSGLSVVMGADSSVETPVALQEQEHLVDDARLLFADVLEQLAAGNRRPHPSARDHMRTFAVIAAMEESHDKGVAVDLADFYERHAVPHEWRPSDLP